MKIVFKKYFFEKEIKQNLLKMRFAKSCFANNNYYLLHFEFFAFEFEYLIDLTKFPRVYALIISLFIFPNLFISFILSKSFLICPAFEIPNFASASNKIAFFNPSFSPPCFPSFSPSCFPSFHFL